MRNRLLGLALILGVVAASCGGGTPEAAGPSEGIQVHGDWTIDIVNPDGSLDQHREFSNDLQNAGKTALAAFVAGTGVPGNWGIRLRGATNDSELCGTATTPEQCELVQPGLTVTPSIGVVTFSGSFEATRDGDVSQVFTMVGTCGSDTAPDDCALFPANIFTSTTVAPAISASTGQTVQVEVEISFGDIP